MMMNSRFSLMAFSSIAALAVLCACLIYGNGGRRIGAGQLRIYIAAGIREPMKKIMDEYESEYGITFETTYEGSGKLLSNIRSNDGEGDLYLAADISYMEKARGFGLIEEVAKIAYQRPCIAVPRGSQKVKSLEDLLSDDVRVSLADTDIAAISFAAKKMLSETQSNGAPIWNQVYRRATVTRGTVNEVANDVKTRTVDAGIVWDATAGQYDELDIVRVPQFEVARKAIALSVLAKSNQPTRALHFLRYVTARDKGISIFSDFGYETVKGDDWAEKPEITLVYGRPHASGNTANGRQIRKTRRGTCRTGRQRVWHPRLADETKRTPRRLLCVRYVFYGKRRRYLSRMAGCIVNGACLNIDKKEGTAARFGTSAANSPGSARRCLRS